MVKRIVNVAGQVAEACGSVVGLRWGTEEPPYTRVSTSPNQMNGIEIRRYGPRIAAETTVLAAAGGSEERARSIGFRRLAGYIFGGNDSATKISMTAPVAQQSEKIAMTAPVAQSTSADGGSVIRFFMPASWTMDTLPEPDDEAVRLVAVPGEVFAVLRFSGDRGADAVAKRSAELLEALHDTGWEPTDTPVAWFYDPPWTIGFRRRNEVAVPVSGH